MAHPTVHQAHSAVVKARGRADTYPCIECGGPARDWAYQHTSESPLETETGRLYSDSVEDYEPMCRGCHQKFDNARGAFRGWKTVWAKRDPEYLVRHGKAIRRNGVKARAALAEKLNDPVEGARIRARQSEGARRGGCSQKRRCLECGVEMNAPAMGRHQNTSGHAGWEKV